MEQGVFDAIGGFFRKGMDEDAMGLFGRDSAALEVEKGIGIEPAYSSPMGASDVIGIDFELGLGTDSGLGREEEIPIGLTGIGFLCTGTDENAAAEQAISVAK